MGFFCSRKLEVLAIVQAIVLAGTLPEWISGENCSCRANLCCSRYGYCGTSNAYCGEGCRAGPCYAPPSGGGSFISSTVTDAFFIGIANQSGGSCAGRGFYTRASFLEAARSYPNFGTGSANAAKREIATFFAHVTHETGHFCYTEEIGGRSGEYCCNYLCTDFCYIEETEGRSRDYCDENNRQYPCEPSKGYYGRGPIQLSWNYNYGAAGRSIEFDGLRNPEIVATNPVIAFKTAFWFWMNNCHTSITSGQGFGATIRAVNGGECNGGNTGAVNARVRYYVDYCNQLGVNPGNNLRC